MRSRAIFTLVIASVCCASAVAAQQNQPPQSQPAPAGPAGSQPPSAPVIGPATAPQQNSAPSPAHVKPAPSAQSNAPGELPKPPVLRRKKHTVRKKALAAANTDPSKIVVRNGGAKDDSLMLSPAIAPDEAQRQRANTTALLALADANLKRVSGRQLSPSQQSTLEEVRTYMRQAQAASHAGDVGRAQTLAYKARLLSDELVRK